MPSNKLLYILPDVTYHAELLPTKKEFTFAVQSFRQINGEFLDENEFLPENIDKLFSKFKGESFTSLILPDYLFTDTIVSIKETDEKAVVAHLKEKLLPSLGLTTDTHSVHSFVLTQFKGQSKVQISAIEKSLLAPIRISAKNHDVRFDGVTALSWSAKSIISLEPSISILQVGSKLYSSLHYIGIDQTTVADLHEIPNIIETIKTLKGGEPSIQTIYLLSNAVVEEQLTEQLKAILPIQQLATFKEDDAKMPSYVKQIIESGMKTLSIPDYLAPAFEITKATPEDEDLVASLAAVTVSDDSSETEAEAEKNNSDENTDSTDSVTDLPVPTAPASTAAAVSQIKHLDLSIDTSDVENETTDAVDTDEKLEPTLESSTVHTINESDTKTNLESLENESVTENVFDDEFKSVKEEPSMPEKDETVLTASTTDNEPVEATDVIDLRKFSKETSSQTDSEPTAVETKVPPTVIKNNSGVGSMMKMVFITLAVFFATVAVGVGVGLGLLKVTQQEVDQNIAPVVIEPASPEPVATESAETVVTFDPSTGYSVLVVNATTKAGYAGTIRSALQKTGFENVSAANAKGEYTTGNYILVDEEIPGLLSYVEEATELTFELDTQNKKQEDAAGAYDIVVVLAE